MVAPHTIKEHMEVVGSDSVHVGTVDHMEGADEIKLTAGDAEAEGEHHFIPLAGSTMSREGAPQAVGRRGQGALENALGYRALFPAVRLTAGRRFSLGVSPGCVSSVS